MAVSSNLVEVSKLLLDEEANIAVLDNESNSSLHTAGLQGNLEITRLLHQWGAEDTLNNAQGKNPMEVALQTKHLHTHREMEVYASTCKGLQTIVSQRMRRHVLEKDIDLLPLPTLLKNNLRCSKI